MFSHIQIKDLEDYFVEMHARKGKGVYFIVSMVTQIKLLVL